MNKSLNKAYQNLKDVIFNSLGLIDANKNK